MKKSTFLIASAFAVSLSLGFQSCSVSDDPVIVTPDTPDEPVDVEIDVTALEWVDNGQACTLDFNNDDASSVFGTDAGPSVGTLSYVDVTEYGIIKLYGTPNQTARLFINREEYDNDGIFFVEIGEDGVGTFECSAILEKQADAKYVHLNGVKASAWNTKLNLSKVTVSGESIF